MICNAISVRNFRNIASADVTFCEGVNILHGRNAQGKTNLLEAIHLVSVGRSFRGAQEAEMIVFDADAAIAKIRASRALGKRTFIVIVSEGMGGDYAEALAKRIQAETGVETKFARFAHIVRGGIPTLRDRLLATRMGQRAVEELFLGNSNLVVCERNGVITTADINYALTLDHLYKGKATDEELAPYSAEEIDAMRVVGDKKRALFRELYGCVERICL